MPAEALCRFCGSFIQAGPEAGGPKTGDITMARMVNCVKLNKEAEGLDYPPFPGELGVRIWKHVSKEAWGEWTRLQTMMVNEYGLNLADASARKHLMTQCERYFFGDGEAAQVPGYKPEAK